MEFVDIFNIIVKWFNENILPLVFALIIIIIAYIFYFLVKHQVLRLKKKGKLEQANAKNIIVIFKIVLYIIVVIIISIQFIERFGVLAGVLTAAAGTIIGFAAMNTLGNVIAGLIIIISKPFNVGDRIMYKDKIADIIDIKLVYTVLKDIDSVYISVPNLSLLKEDIQNYGQERILRRNVKISVSYDVDPRLVEKALFDAASKFSNILKYPEPRVDLYEYLDYAIQYRLLVYINSSKLIPKFDYDLKKAVYYSCKDYKIDLKTPSLIQSVDNKDIKAPPP
ncbi:MAG: mechanosensitive ion channel [Promethearchaeota archaeon]|nr:MAG: mechanosensitive ion channel [Candidatus Lokiarchaeota archaeon]